MYLLGQGGSPMKHRKRIVISATGAMLALVALRHPTADLRIMTHEARDTAPHRVQAAIDLGLVGVSILNDGSSAR